MTDIASFTIPEEPVAHGFRPGIRDGRPAILKGSSPHNEKQLQAWQDRVRTAGCAWLDSRQTNWPHYYQPIALVVACHLTRPTTYTAEEAWHRTNRPGDTVTLERAVSDALQGVFYENDGQVAFSACVKTTLAGRDRYAQHVDIWVAPAWQAGHVMPLVLRTLPAQVPARNPIPDDEATFQRPVISGQHSRGAVTPEHTGAVKPTSRLRRSGSVSVLADRSGLLWRWGR